VQTGDTMTPRKARSDEGSVEAWRHVWSSLTTEEEECLYTPSEPQTLRQFWQRSYFEDLWRLMSVTASGARYCELGSGRGTTSTYLRSKQCDVTMVDLSEEAFRVAALNFDRLRFERPHMVCADVRCTGLASASFDCVFSIGLLEHFSDPKPVLKETLRLLRPGGLSFAVIVPSKSILRTAHVRVLNPPRLIYNVGMEMSARLGQKLRPVDATSSDMTRTTYDCGQWAAWASELGACDVECCFYNPYPSIYRSPKLERLITLPLYRAHVRARERRHVTPTLMCREHVSMAQLLTFRSGHQR